MADFFSHDLFGERMLAHLPAAAQSAAALHSAAYHWGLHGPDPLFFHKVALGSPLHKLGNRMHSERTGELFAAFADAVGRLQDENRVIGEAYFYGFVCHYALDSLIHPYVYYHQAQIAALDDTRSGSAIHCQIETDIDWALYEREKGGCITEFSFAEKYALSTEETAVLAVLLRHLLRRVYGVDVPTAELRPMFREMSTCQEIFLNCNPNLGAGLGTLERAVRHSGILTSHFKLRAPDWDCLNLEHTPWHNLWEPEKERLESIPELFDRAENRAAALANNYAFQFDEGWQLNLSFYEPFDCGSCKREPDEELQ